MQDWPLKAGYLPTQEVLIIDGKSYDATSLAHLPEVQAGDSISCSRCGDAHTLEHPTVGDTTLPEVRMACYFCGGLPYIGALFGRLVENERLRF